MRRIARIAYQRRYEVLTFLGIIWVLLAIITRNPAEALVLVIFTAPITLTVLVVIALLFGGIER
jgi:hypothetical protein